MKEIKFRAWDAGRYEMVYFDFFGIDGGVVFSNAGVISLGEEEIEKTVGQYTGLKDKNGKEIYEGDILKYLDGDIQRGGYKKVGGGNYVVVFDIYKYKLSRIDCKRYVREVNGIGLVQCRPKEFEVIGNIYENPELMEDK